MFFLDEKDITDMPMYKRAKEGIGYLPQEASVFRNLSVEDNIMSILEFQKKLLPKENNVWNNCLMSSLYKKYA